MCCVCESQAVQKLPQNAFPICTRYLSLQNSNSAAVE